MGSNPMPASLTLWAVPHRRTRCFRIEDSRSVSADEITEAGAASLTLTRLTTMGYTPMMAGKWLFLTPYVHNVFAHTLNVTFDATHGLW